METDTVRSRIVTGRKDNLECPCGQSDRANFYRLPVPRIRAKVLRYRKISNGQGYRAEISVANEDPCDRVPTFARHHPA